MSQAVVEDLIFAEYLQCRASEVGQPLAEVAKTVNRDEFYENIYALHCQFMSGEFSLGYMAELLGINKADLYHPLDAMGLKATNI
jgi:hypothetical protein